MQPIGFLGHGTLGKHVHHYLSEAGLVTKFVAFDSLEYDQKVPHAVAFDGWQESAYADFEIYVCLGYKRLADRARLIAELQSNNRRLGRFIHSRADVSSSAKVGAGCLIFPRTLIDWKAELKSGVVAHCAVVVSHHSIIGESTFLAPGVIVSGDVEIGARTFIGSGSVISNGVRIGDDCIVGAGTVVTRDVPSGTSVIGNPMNRLAKPLQLK